MAEETKKTEQIEDTNQMYIDEINNLKANSVSKQEYEKIMAENRNLLKSLVQGTQTSAEEEKKEEASYKDLQQILQSEDSSNLDYLKASLEHRNKRLAETGVDEYLPLGHNIAPTDEDIAAAEQVAKFLGDLIESADGNSLVLTNEYQRLVGDSAPIRRKR